MLGSAPLSMEEFEGKEALHIQSRICIAIIQIDIKIFTNINICA
jgi:hypothetical protein